jgi:hypothetical protein
MFFSSSRIAACSDCRSLTGGADPYAVPHEYLVLRRPGQTSIYQCLVCHTNLTCDAESGSPQWLALSPDPDNTGHQRGPATDRPTQAQR